MKTHKEMLRVIVREVKSTSMITWVNRFIDEADEVLQMDEGWVNVEDHMPEYNVGVLVFIPAEDGHITSGMYDISNKWTLLDEYRTPDSPVTHWMPMPDKPKKA